VTGAQNAEFHPVLRFAGGRAAGAMVRLVSRSLRIKFHGIYLKVIMLPADDEEEAQR